MLRRRKSDVQKGPPLRTLRLSHQDHVRFLRETIPFLRITGDARANHVFPGRHPPAIARDDVIKVEIDPIKNIPAVLAGILVPLKNVMPGKFHFLLRKPIEEEKYDNARHPDFPGNGGNQFMIRRVGRKAAPTVKIVGQKIIRFVGRNDMGVPGIDQRKGATGRADIHRLPKAV